MERWSSLVVLSLAVVLSAGCRPSDPPAPDPAPRAPSSSSATDTAPDDVGSPPAGHDQPAPESATPAAPDTVAGTPAATASGSGEPPDGEPPNSLGSVVAEHATPKPSATPPRETDLGREPVEAESDPESGTEMPDPSDAEAFRKFVTRNKVPSGWEHRDTRNFLIVHRDAVDAWVIDGIAENADALLTEVLAVKLPSAGATKAVTVIRVCADRKEFRDYGGPSGASGYFSPGGMEAVLYVDQSDKRDAIRTAQGLVTHMHMRAALSGSAAHPWHAIGHTRAFAWLRRTKGRFVDIDQRVLQFDTTKRKQAWLGVTLGDWLAWDLAVFSGSNPAGLEPHANIALATDFVVFLHMTKNASWAQILPRYWSALRDAAAGTDEKTTESIDQPALRKQALDAALEGVDLEALEAAWVVF